MRVRDPSVREPLVTVMTTELLTDPAAWVRAHGSPRLKLILDAGMLDNSMAVYHEERTAIELPEGYKYRANPWTDIRRNPTEAEVIALLEERKTYPGAALINLATVKPGTKPGIKLQRHHLQWTPAITIPLPWEPKRTAVKILGWG